jgi:hypothetical protein
MFSTPRRQRIGWVLIYVIAAAVILGMVGGVAAIRQTQIDGTPTGQKLLQASDRILDCTDPEGQCYRDSQARTAKAVGDINKVIVLAAACSVGLENNLTVDERQIAIQRCVIERLAQQTKKS